MASSKTSQSPMEMATGYLTFPMSLVPMLPTASLPMPMQGLVGTAAITPGRGIGRFTRAWDFLFTDFHNELEFLTYIQTLGRNDDALLVGCLEMLASKVKGHVPHRVHLREVIPELADQVEAAYRNHQFQFTKELRNVLWLMQAHTGMISLQAHNYNIYELAMLGQKKFGFVLAMICFGLQIILFFTLVQFYVRKSMWNYIGYQGTQEYDSWEAHDDIEHVEESEGPIEVVIIMIGVSLVIMNLAYNQMEQCRVFDRAFRHPSQRSGRYDFTYQIARCCNLFTNIVLPWCLVTFNVLWLLSQPSPEDAILNGLALVFIWDLDEMLVPDSQ